MQEHEQDQEQAQQIPLIRLDDVEPVVEKPTHNIVGAVIVVRHSDGGYGLMFCDEIQTSQADPVEGAKGTFDMRMRVHDPKTYFAHKADFTSAQRLQGAYMPGGTYLVDQAPREQKKVERARISIHKK